MLDTTATAVVLVKDWLASLRLRSGSCRRNSDDDGIDDDL